MLLCCSKKKPYRFPHWLPNQAFTEKTNNKPKKKTPNLHALKNKHQQPESPWFLRKEKNNENVANYEENKAPDLAPYQTNILSNKNISHWAVRWIKEDCCVFVQTTMTSVLHLPDNTVNKPLSCQYQSLKFSCFASSRVVYIRMKYRALENLPTKMKSKLFVETDFGELIIFLFVFFLFCFDFCFFTV